MGDLGYLGDEGPITRENPQSVSCRSGLGPKEGELGVYWYSTAEVADAKFAQRSQKPRHIGDNQVVQDPNILK